ncbi:MAG TPA: pitrilysin family protein [Candidatus Binataceae bacterium]|nr:pitrilysin family protein [Candidatus Binataceae bacterium]
MYILLSGNHRRFLLIAVMAALAILAPLANAFAGISDAVQTETLPNGTRVLVLENHKAPVATLNIFYRVGSRNEQFGKTGLSHLLEHLMFKGTKKLQPEQFSQIIQDNGGMDNAFTEYDLTDYFEMINKNHFDVPISLEADRMANFAPKQFEQEKAVVLEERRMRTEDNPEDALDEMVRSQAYVAHPYHWPVIGWFHDVSGLTLQDAYNYHSIYYSPQNAIIVAVGDFDAHQVLKQISEAFGSIKNGAKPPPVTEVEPPQDGERHIDVRHAANLPAFEWAYHVPNYKSADSFPLEIASEILSDGKSSRLYKDLVINKRMVVDIGAGYDMTSLDPGLFVVSAQIRPGVKLDDVMAETENQLSALAAAMPAADELQKAKNLEQAEFVFGQDSVLNEAMLLGRYELMGDYHLIDQYLPSIDKVTAADVQRVVKQYLVATNRTNGQLVPTGILPHGGGGMSGGQLRHAPGFPVAAGEVVQ